MSVRDDIRASRHQQGQAARERVLSGQYSQQGQGQAKEPESIRDRIRNRSVDTVQPAIVASPTFKPTPTPLQPPVSRTNFKTLADDLKVKAYVDKGKAARDAQDPKNPILKALKDNTIDLLGEGADRVLAGGTGFKPLDAAGRFLNQFSQGAGDSVGVDTQAAGAAPLVSTGSKVADTIARGAGAIAGVAANPAQIEQNLITSPYRAAQALTSRVNIPNNLARRAAEGAVAGGIQGAANSGVRGETDVGDVAKSALVGAALGGAGDAAIGAIGGVARNLKRRATSPIPAAKPDPQQALPLGRADAARARSVNAPGTEPVVTPYAFGLPEAPAAVRNTGDNIATARNELKAVDDEIRQLNSSYDRAIVDEYNYLKSSMGQGASPGGVTKDQFGEVTSRYGSVSNNPKWYRDFLATNKRKPNNKELHQIAKERVDNGFIDDAGEIPGWKAQNNFDETAQSLNLVKQQIEASVREIDPALNVTSSPLRSQELSFKPTARSPIRNEEALNAPVIDVTPVGRPMTSTEPSSSTLGISAFAKRPGPYDNLKTSTKSQLVTRQTKERQPVKAVKDKLYTAVVDDLDPLNRFDKEVERVIGKQLGASDKSHTLALNSRGADVIARQNLTAKQVDISGNVVGKSLKDILSQLPKNEHSYVDFEDYLVNKHAITRMEDRGEKVFRDELNWTPDVGRQIVADYEATHPEFKTMADEIYGFQQNMVQRWLVDTGLIPQAQADAYFKANPTYVPMKRFFSELEKGGGAKGSKSKKGFGNQSAPVKGYTPGGSERKIISPIEAMIENVDAFVKAAKRNESMQALARNLERDPEALRAFAEFVPEEQIAGAQSLKGLNQTLQDEGVEGIIAKLGEDFDMSFRKATQRGLDKDNIVRVMIDGEPKYIQINDKPLLEAITAMGPDASNVVMDFLGKVTSMFKTLTTGANPIFSLTRNIMRDIPQAYAASKTTGNPARFLADLAQSTVAIAKDNELYQQYKNLGGGHSSPAAADRNLLAQTKRQILPQRGSKLKGIVPRGYDKLQNALNALESAPRLGEFKRTGANAEGIAAAQDVTTNFKRRGKVGKQLDKVFPYFNAAVQGLDKNVRMFRDMPVKTITKAALAVSLPSMISYAINYDDPDYQKVSKRTKDNFLLLPKGDGTFWKIAKPKELGTIFADIPERLLQKFAMDDPDAFRDFADQIRTTFSLPGIQGALKSGGITDRLAGVLGDTVVGPVADVAANKNFAGSPIVPGYLANLSPELQSDPRTTVVAKKIGEMTGTSPKALDYLFRQYTGVLGQIGTPLLSPGGSLGNALVQQVTVDPVFSNDISNKMYADKDKLDQARTDYNVTGEVPADYNDGLRKYLGRITDAMGDIRKQMRVIEADRSLPGATKRKQLRDLQEQINVMAGEGNGAVQSTK